MSESSSPKSVSELFGIPDPPQNASDRLISTAIDLFYRHGFNAVGIDRIYNTAGVAKTTFYKYFHSKDDIMVAAVRTRDAWEMKAWDRAVGKVSGDDPIARLIGIFKVLDCWFSSPDFGGCMFLNVASEFPNPNHPVHKAAAAYKRKGHQEYKKLATRSRFKNPDEFADRYTMLLEGTLILRQVHGRNDAAKIALPFVKKMIDDQILE